MSHPRYDEEHYYQYPNLWRGHIQNPDWHNAYYPKQFTWIFKGKSGLVPIVVCRDITYDTLIWDFDPNLIRLINDRWSYPLKTQETWAINEAFYWINHPEESPIKGLSPQELLTKLFYYDSYTD